MPTDATEVRDAVLERYGILAGHPLGADTPEHAGQLLVCCTELTTDEDIAALEAAIRGVLA